MANLEESEILGRLNKVHGTKYTSLKEKQWEVISRSKESDVVGVLSTGYGKTIIIQVLPYLKTDSFGCVVVVNPLNAILDEQKER